MRSQWSGYPDQWSKNKDLNLGHETLGEEWGKPEFADLIIDELVAEYLTPDADVIELGCGGGKFSQRIAPRVRSLTCCDISQQMIDQTKHELKIKGVDGNVSCKVLNGVDFQGLAADSADFIFSYDVQLHLQPQNVFSYMVDANRVLRDGGVFMLHQIRLNSPGGISHFLSQHHGNTWDMPFDDPGRLGHIYYMSRDQMCALADPAGLETLAVVEDFPGEQSPLHAVIRERDIFGFFTARLSRLNQDQRVVKLDTSEVVWVILDDGTRAALGSPLQFERAGFSWDAVQTIDSGEFAALPQASEPLATWE